ncbi:type II toxin-antitoxin system VapB family antitoxin [Acidisoma silvae]|uniref:Type II toxin-antitoxin system VapB family antitoxin n=1 Tax=Acidisoma silvae TaxID=2802396 RepID=A0A964DYJ5_9PROT|nr:type II toxin-antitoxin system VapB family antitoxin [Acidisoma silvae]MCB8875147.1 type II toxin-antitoxin system VapB family antitoxin [Acidisoma silvae]
MRTNIDIDDDLLAQALEVSGLRTKKAVVEDALRLLVETAGQRQAIETMRGMGWEGDLDAIRSNRR